MSAIAGVVRFDGRRLDPGELAPAMRALAPRFRTTPVLWTDAGAGLAGDCVATWPRQTGPARFAIAADARLDNRAELTDALSLRDSQSDAALILHAYLKWGEDSPSHLLGDFAFAIWDGGRGRLFCARDPVGVRPFCYAVRHNGIQFGSELKALVQRDRRGEPSRDDNIRIDDTYVADFLAGLVTDAQSTCLRNAFRLPPGHTLVATDGRLRVAAYWKPGAAASSAPRGDVVEAFSDLFEKAVACRTTASTGVLLSGGLDSSAVALVAAGASRQPLSTLSLVFRSSADERGYIDQVLQRRAFDPTFIAADAHGPFDRFDQVLKEQDGLFLAPGLAFNHLLYRTAAQRGLTSLLDGHGGDEVVSHGLGRLKQFCLAGQWGALWRNVRAEADVYGASRLALFLTYWFHFGSARPAAKAAHRLRAAFDRRLSLASDRQAVPAWRRFINADLARTTDLDGRRVAASARSNGFTTEREQHRAMLEAPLQAHALEVLDRSSAHAGVEPRYPFWDRRLIEFCLALEPQDKLHDGWTRYTFRRAMEGVLPSSIQWRRGKFDFTRGLATAMYAHHTALLDDIFLNQPNSLADFVDLATVREAHARVRARPDQARGADVQVVWRSAALALWLQNPHPWATDQPAANVDAERPAESVA